MVRVACAFLWYCHGIVDVIAYMSLFWETHQAVGVETSVVKAKVVFRATVCYIAGFCHDFGDDYGIFRSTGVIG